MSEPQIPGKQIISPSPVIIDTARSISRRKRNHGSLRNKAFQCCRDLTLSWVTLIVTKQSQNLFTPIFLFHNPDKLIALSTQINYLINLCRRFKHLKIQVTNITKSSSSLFVIQIRITSIQFRIIRIMIVIHVFHLNLRLETHITFETCQIIIPIKRQTRKIIWGQNIHIRRYRERSLQILNHLLTLRG